MTMSRLQFAAMPAACALGSGPVNGSSQTDAAFSTFLHEAPARRDDPSPRALPSRNSETDGAAGDAQQTTDHWRKAAETAQHIAIRTDLSGGGPPNPQIHPAVDPAKAPTEAPRSWAVSAALNYISATPLRERIFGFLDLGVFGLDGSETADRIVDMGRGPESVPSTPPSRTLAPAADLMEQGLEPREQTNSAEPILDETQDVGPSTHRSGQTALIANLAASFALDDVPRTSPASAEAETESGWVPTARIAIPERQNAARFCVTVSGTDDALAIAVRAPEEMLAGQVQQLIERTTAEFDTKVGDLRINGAPDHSTPTPRSSTRGSNSR